MNIVHNKNHQSIIEKITNLIPVPKIPLVSSGKTRENHDNSCIFDKFPGSELTRLLTDKDGPEQSSIVSENVPLEYLYLLYRL